MALMILAIDDKEDRADDDLFSPLYWPCVSGEAPKLRGDIIFGNQVYGPVPHGLTAKLFLVARERIPESQAETDFPGFIVHDSGFVNNLNYLCERILATVMNVAEPRVVYLLWDRKLTPSRWEGIDSNDTTPALDYLLTVLERAGIHVHRIGKTAPEQSLTICIPFLVSAGPVPTDKTYSCVGKESMWKELRNHFREPQWRGATHQFYSPISLRTGADNEVSDIPLSEDDIIDKKNVILNRSLDRLGVLREQLLSDLPVDGLFRCKNDLELANDSNDLHPWAVFIDDRPRETKVEVFTLKNDAPEFRHNDPHPLQDAIENALRQTDWQSQFGWVQCCLTDNDVYHLYDLLKKRVSKVSKPNDRQERDRSGSEFIPDDYKKAISTLRSKLPTMIIETIKRDGSTYYVCRGDYLRIRRGLLRP